MSGKRTEDAYGEKVDRCLYNSLSKFVVGVGIGIVTAAVVRFKPWPIILGSGVGIGMGISDCNYEFKAGSLTKVVQQSLEPTAKKKMPPYAIQQKKLVPLGSESEQDSEDWELERKERFAGIVGRSSHRSSDF